MLVFAVGPARVGDHDFSLYSQTSQLAEFAKSMGARHTAQTEVSNALFLLLLLS